MKKKIIQTIDRKRMLKKGMHIIIGLSGGPDSVCLLMCSLKWPTIWIGIYAPCMSITDSGLWQQTMIKDMWKNSAQEKIYRVTYIKQIVPPWPESLA